MCRRTELFHHLDCGRQAEPAGQHAPGQEPAGARESAGCDCCPMGTSPTETRNRPNGDDDFLKRPPRGSTAWSPDRNQNAAPKVTPPPRGLPTWGDAQLGRATI
jgi:hypothetical protein